MATRVAGAKGVKEFVFEWEGKDRNGKIVRGETRAAGENQVQATLRRQGVLVTKIKKRRMRSGKRIKPKDIAIFTRQLATMMKAGVPLLQSFDIVARGNPNPSVTKLLNDIRADIETGTSLSAAFRKYPLYFNSLYCNLVEAGEAAGILEEPAGPPGHLHGKDRGDQVQDQVGPDVPHRGASSWPSWWSP
jgi:type IV pilus assembly protein PilC